SVGGAAMPRRPLHRRIDMSRRQRLIVAASLGLISWSAAGAGEQAAAPLALHLRAGVVDTSAARADLAQALPELAGTPVVIQLDGPITPARRARLEAAGVRLGDYLPDHAYIALLDGARPGAVAGLEFVRWWSPCQTAWKLDPEIGLRTCSNSHRRTLVRQGRDQFVVALFSFADPAQTAQAIWALPGAAVLAEEQIGNHWELTIEANLASAPALAQIPGVQFVEPAPDITPRSNLTTRWIVQSNEPGVFPVYAAGIRGEGQIV